VCQNSSNVLNCGVMCLLLNHHEALPEGSLSVVSLIIRKKNNLFSIPKLNSDVVIPIFGNFRAHHRIKCSRDDLTN